MASSQAVASARIQKKWKQEDLANKLAKTVRLRPVLLRDDVCGITPSPTKVLMRHAGIPERPDPFSQKPVVVDLEAGKLKRDNKLLQKAENVLGVWLTGEAERIGTPKTRGKAAASDSGTATPSGSRGSSSSSSGGEETHDKGQNQNKKKADSDKKIKIEGSTGEKREQMSGTAEEGTAAVGNGEGSSEPAQGTTSMIINSSAANA